MSKRKTKKRKAQALNLAGGSLNLVGSASIRAAETPSADGKPKQRTFDLVAYSGGPIEQCAMGWSYPVIVDLQGLDLGDGTFPILDNHGPKDSFFSGGNKKEIREYVIGQSNTAKVEGNQLKLSGAMFQTEASSEIISLADQGFRWQASIGARVSVKDFVDEGSKVDVNGSTYEGPVYVARKTVLREVSFVVLGADKDTSALVASHKGRGMKMTFTEWMTLKGFGSVDTMPEPLRNRLRAEYQEEDDEDEDEEDEDKDTEADEDDDKKEKKTEAEEDDDKKKDKDTEADEDDEDDKKKDTKAKATKASGAALNLRAESTRIAKIQMICATNPAIAAKALEKGWSVKKAELEMLRASRPSTGPHFYSPSQPALNEAVLEAAVLQAGNCRLWDASFYIDADGSRRVSEREERAIKAELNTRYSDQVQQSAHSLFKGRIGLQQVLVAGAKMNGARVSEVIRDDSDLEAVLRANNWSLRADAASTASISNVLANVLNKFLLQGYKFVEQTWSDIAGRMPVKDFKPTKSVNLFGDFIYKDIGQNGQLEGATLSDQAFANAATSTGRILTINRQMIINDDMNALTSVPLLMGRGAALKLNDTFWKTFLSPGNGDDGQPFFNASGATHGSTNSGANYFSGGTSVLANAGLTTAVQLFDKQVDPKNYPLGIDASILLYPPELQTPALELMNSQFIVYGGGSAAKQGNTNIFQGRFKPLKSRYLSNSNYSGYSATGWYLLADPGMIPVIQVAFLNGQESPTVQTAQAEFQTLGISVRGFFDFGVAMQNFRGGVKSAGA